LTFNQKREKIFNKTLHYSVKVPPKKVEFLTQNEIDILEDLSINSERLTIIRDLFIFSCYSGLGYAELKNLHKDHLRVIDDQIWIYMIRQKTKRHFKVPLLPKCVRIIEKYSMHKSIFKKGLLLPVPSNQRYNEYLKELNLKSGISIPLTTHLARRTFACTVLLRNNVHLQIVSQLLGHSSTSTTMKSYISEVPELMISEFEKVKNVYGRE
jgi:integrase